MGKFLKIILITLIALFGLGLFSAGPVLASGIIITPEPVFNINNFVPGQSVSSTVIIENNSSNNCESITISGIRNGSVPTPDLAEVIDLKIEGINMNLADFLDGNSLVLPDGKIDSGEEKQFEFIAELKQDAGNEYQGKNINFDFIFHFQGKVTDTSDANDGNEINNEIAISGIGGGGFLITGLEIYNEMIPETGLNQVTISWQTNKLATSRVIYSSEHQPHTLLLDSPPDYGYAHSTAEDSTPKTSHQMIIAGLESGITYYFRCVSRGSLAVSKELKFTTAGVKGEEVIFEPSVFPSPPIPDVLGEEIERTEGEEINGEETEDEDVLKEETFALDEGKEIDAEGKSNLCWLLLAIIVALIILSLLWIKKKQAKKKWILPVLTLVAAIIYYFFCCLNCWILILLAVILLILSLILTKKEDNKK